MQLNFTLSEEELSCLNLLDSEEIYYCIPSDIDEKGTLRQHSFLVMTNQRVLLLEEGKLTKNFFIAECEKLVCEPQIACGLLYCLLEGKPVLLCRYSSKHMIRFSYLPRGMQILKQGRTERVISVEYEKSCPKCGRALPGTKDCPKCSGKKQGIVYVLGTMLNPHKRKLAVILIFMMLATIVTLANPAIQKYLIDDVLNGDRQNTGEAVLCLLLMLVMSVSIIIINVIKSYLCSKLGSEISEAQRKKLFVKIQTLSLSFINERSPGELMNRIIQDTHRIRDFVSDVFCNMFTVSVLFVGVCIYMLILNWKLAILAFLFVPVSVAVSMAYRNRMRKRFRLQGAKSDKLNSNLQDVISGMTVVKTYGQEQREAEHFNDSADEYARIQRGNEIFFSIFYPILSFCLGAGIYLVTYFGGKLTLADQMTSGELLQFISYVNLMYTYVNWLSNMPRVFMNFVTSVERIGDVENQEPTIYNREHAVKHDILGDITFRDASFGYKSYKPVLEKINLSIKKGEMIGLVGASGTGKSTLINLVMHLYEVDDGEVLIDGVDIKDIDLAYYHSQIGVVLQENFLFAGTILNNIRFANQNASIEEVIRAAKMANAHDFILKTPDGYNTYVGEHGYNLSGGERQRIAIARAILHNPKLLILDEATASLDTESEYLIQTALKRLIEGRTTIAIAHRLSTLRDADRLVVIDGHNIAEVGTHEELMEKKGIYYGLVQAQFKMLNMDNN